MMAATPPITSGSAGSPEQNLDKMIKHQERIFGLEITKEIAKSQHDMLISTARTLGQSS
ncbi:hypothetical protein [Mesorhizobium sp. M3A.F.Ca.ET.175.01.1.1]|uniref:hypothetical protein n=1 Tax=Mesorhizobium sp. M3A.F.Ca.ET.175.01.1.1 TaxID=2563945 RepID=UPI0016777247|nr:hypothetical protein [Mesorhizobium sp. M3A.F.Ca.ET.175.01.1.1]